MKMVCTENKKCIYKTLVYGDGVMYCFIGYMNGIFEVPEVIFFYLYTEGKIFVGFQWNIYVEYSDR